MAIAIGTRPHVSARSDERSVVRLPVAFARWFGRAGTAATARASIASVPDDLAWLDIGDV